MAAVLLVDGNAGFAAGLTQALGECGFTTLVTNDAGEALRLLRQHRPAAVVVALQLPGGGALDLRERMVEEGESSIPVLYVADAGHQRDIDQATRAGAIVLPRPRSPRELVAPLRQLLSSREAQAQGSERKRTALNLLVVEDDPELRLKIESRLRAPGREDVEITWAESVEEACRLVAAGRYQCVLLKQALPDGRGVEVLERCEEQLLTTPVVGLGATDDPATAVEYLRAGCVDFFGRTDVLEDQRLRRRLAEAMSRSQRRAMATLIERQQLRSAILHSQERLISLARMDHLTGVCNRAVFDEYHDPYHREICQQGGGYAVCMADVDRFKQYNDGYGHAAGDEALRAVAQALRDDLRERDFIARYGGEEIVLLLDDVTREAAAVVADRLRRAVYDLHIPHAGNPPSGRVTVSVGVAVFGGGCQLSAKRLLLCADGAMYEAKAAGRNRVVVVVPGAVAAQAA
jgi:diguanylate cyclase (GGDEF)-like protein